MKVERSQPSRNHNVPLFGCGCVVLLAIGVVVGVTALFALLPGIVPKLVLQTAGFENIGDTDAIFADTPLPAPTLVQRGNIPPSVTIVADTGQVTIPGSGEGYAIQTGSNAISAELQMTFNEDGLLTLCRQFTVYCTPDGTQALRDLRFDVRSGGVILQGEFELQTGLRQRAGLVLRLSGQQIEITGVEIDGQVYAAAQSEFAAQINQAQAEINRLLAQVNVTAGNESYRLHRVYTDENRITIVLR